MKLGLIGTGLMGRPMAERLLEAGHEVMVFNRTRAKAQPLKDLGAGLGDSPRDVVTFAEATVLMLADAPAVDAVLTGAGDPALSKKTVIQMSTIGPVQSRGFAERVRGAGGTYLEAPVLGSTPQAAAGKLLVLAGGDRAEFDRWLPVLEVFGPEPKLLGPVGSGAATKLAFNQLIASLASAYSYGLGLIQRHDIDPETYMALLRRSALYAPAADGKLSRWLSRDFTEPHFPVKHLLKDVKLAVEAGRSVGLDPEVLDGACAVLQTAMERGLGELDYSALFEVIVPRA